MIRRLVLLTLLATCGLDAAIKKAGEPQPAPKSPPAKSADESKTDRPGSGLLEELKKRADRDGGRLRMNGPEFAEILRGLLEKQGVPKEQLKNAGLLELLKLLREKNPGEFGDLELGALPFSKKLEKQLNDHFQQLLEGHRPGAAKTAPATFVFRDGSKPGGQLAFGTAVDSAGWLLTKASEVRKAGTLECQIRGEWIAARVARVWEEHDLALVKVAAADLPVVQWAGDTAPAVGTFVTAVAPEGKDPVAIGVVSVAARNDRQKGSGFLGVALASDEKGLKVRQVIPGGAANTSGMQPEDRILELDGRKPESVFTFTKMVSERKAGEKVRLKLQRGDQVMEKEIALGDRGAAPGAGRQRFDKVNSLGSTVNDRKSDFPSVLQTDLPLDASQCGGPVTDLDGNVIGLVIARSGRVETMVIPSGTIRQSLAGVDFSKEPQTVPARPVPKK
jgi:S1-C subfamily serine protease